MVSKAEAIAELQRRKATKSSTFAADAKDVFGSITARGIPEALAAATPLGMGANIVRGVSDVTRWLGKQAYEGITGDELLSSGANPIPTSSDILTAALKPTGLEMYTPQTTAGKYANTATQFAVGGKLLDPKASLKMLTASGLLSEGAGQATEGTDYEIPARILAGISPNIAAGIKNAATKKVASGLGVDPQKIAELEAAGLPVSVPAVSNSPSVKNAAATLSDIWGGKKLKASMDKAFDAADNSIKSLGYKGTTTPTQAGKVVEGALARWKAESLKKFNDIDDQLKAVVPDDAPVSVYGNVAPMDDAFRQSIKSEIQQFDGVTIPAAKYGISQDMVDVPIGDVVSSLEIVRRGNIKPQNVLSEIKKLGGIRPDDLGELKATGLTNKNLVGVVNNKGLPLDYMREALVERGVLTEVADINDLLNLVENQARGITGAVQNSNYELASRFLDDIGIDTTTALEKYRTAGDDIVQGLRSERDFLKRQFLEGDYAVNPKQQNTLSSAINNIITDKGLTPRQIAERGNHPAVVEMRKLMDDAAKNDGQLTVAALKEARTKIGDMVNPNPLMPSKTDAIAKRSYGAVSNLIEDAAEQIGGKEARELFKKRNILYKNYANEQSNFVGKLQKKLGDSPESIWQSLTRNDKVGASSAKRVFAKLNPDEMDTVFDAIIHQKGGAENFTIGKWVTEYQKLSDESQKALFSGKPSLKVAHDNLIKAVDNYKDIGRFANNSRTTTTALNPIVKLVTGGTTGAIGYATGTLPAIIGAAGLSYGLNRAVSGMLASPKYTKLLANALTETTPQGIAKYIPAIQKGLMVYGASRDDVDNLMTPDAPASAGITREDAIKELERRRSVQLPATIPDTQPQASLLNRIMQAESGGRPMAMNDKSTAAGLYQFTDGTWASMVKKYGNAYGITKADKMNPQAQQTMANLLLQENGNILTRSLGRNLDDGDYYVAHVLGAGDAARMLKAHDKGKSLPAAQLVAKGVPSANRGIFYDGNRPRSVKEVVAILKNKVKVT